MADYDESIRKIQLIKDLGIEIALDDFGTGFSSLNYLFHLPLSTVKIDRTFMLQMPTNHRYKQMVEAIIEIAHALGFSVVAEGIETIQQKKMLTGMNCDILQGYLFSKPMPESEEFKI